MISEIIKKYKIRSPKAISLLHGIWFAYLDFEKNRRELIKEELKKKRGDHQW